MDSTWGQEEPSGAGGEAMPSTSTFDGGDEEGLFVAEPPAESRVAIDLETVPGIGYDLVHNGRPFVTRLEVRPLGAKPEVDVTVTVVLRDGDDVVAGPWSREYPLIAGSGLALEPDLDLDPAFMRSVEEERPVRLEVAVSSGVTALGRLSRRMTLFAHNEWMLVDGSLSHLTMSLLAAHVQPNDPVIAEILNAARELLGRRTGDSATQGYQSGRERAAAIAQGIYDAIVSLGFDYSNPPASWNELQKVRTHAQVIEQRAATCLDSAVLYAAALEAAGLNPQIWLPPGHALVGIWLSEEYALPEAVLDSPEVTSLALNLVDSGRILLVETTVMARGASFSEAARMGNAAVNGGLAPINAVVDVGLARRRGVIPLPVVRTAPNGAVEVHNYNAAEIRIVKERRKDDEVLRDSSLPEKVQLWKNTLLDLSSRNQLIRFKPNASMLELVMPASQADFHPLDFIEDELHAGHSFSLLPLDLPDLQGFRGGVRAEAQALAAALLAGERKAIARVEDAYYASRVRKLRYASRSSIQETGTNNLFLTLGSLVWSPDGGEEYRSPLILVPVTIEGGTRGTFFRVRLDEAGASTPNYTLLERLKLDHGLQLPHLENPLEDQYGLAVRDIFDKVRLAIADAGLPFRVDETAHLAVLQFAKFRLWKDLDEHWERFAARPLVRHLIESRTEPFLDQVATHEEPRNLDELAASCPIPADATQLAAIDAAVNGQTFVLEGPPGTGKSQTITNLLARAMAEGRKVLFVAEKRAALDVVHSRIEAVGLGPFCLDLHDKGSKPALVRHQLLHSLEHEPARDVAGVEAAQSAVRAAVTSLARYRDRLHAPNPAGLSYYGAHERTLAIKSQEPDAVPAPVTPEEAAQLSDDTWRALRPRLLEMGERLDEAEGELDGPWSLAGPVSVDELDRRALAELLGRLFDSLELALAEEAGREALSLVLVGEERRLIQNFVQGDPPRLAELDQIAQPDWGANLRFHLGQVDGAVHSMRGAGATPALWSLPLESLHAGALKADAAGMFSRKKQRAAVLAQLQAGMSPLDSEAAGREVAPLLAMLLAAQQQAERALSALAGLVGLAAAAQLNPLDVEQLEGFRGQASWLEWYAAAVTNESAERELVRAYAAAAIRPGRAIQAAEDFGQAWSELRAVLLIDDDSLGRWRAGQSLVDALESCRSPWLADATGLHFRRLALWLRVAPVLFELQQAGLPSVVPFVLGRHSDPLQLEFSVTLGVVLASLNERAETSRLDVFQRQAHSRAIQRFSDASASLRDRMRDEIPAALVASRPFNAASLVGEVGALQRELNRPRGGLSIRGLLQRYGSIIKELTPCFLVSPDSAARFLVPGAIDFDLVVFDEASQIRVAEAIGPMGRGRAAVIVGDSRQMPPSTFGAKSTEADDDLDIDDEDMTDEESILSECIQARVPRRWLSWHYRSRDEALIAFSNSKYYDGRLSSFPAPHRAGGPNVSHVFVEGGHFYRPSEGGPTGTNPKEAEAIVADVVERFRRDPKTSLGIVTFNIQQRDHILTLLAKSSESAVVESLESDDSDSLFVKNLENVQGDERDVILFSLAFSKNARGILPLNFGPLQRKGGERRLNVAVTRARAAVRVYSSFWPQDMRLESTSSLGLRHLHDYLLLAIRGTEELAHTLGRTPTPEDRHREDVAQALRQRGWPVRTDVGLSGFRVDLVVGQKERAERDLAAVLLDGPAWARRPTVGDRDGLPVDVLSKLLRWPAVRRVWLPSWLEDRDRVLDELEADFEEAQDQADQRELLEEARRETAREAEPDDVTVEDGLAAWPQAAAEGAARDSLSDPPEALDFPEPPDEAAAPIDATAPGRPEELAGTPRQANPDPAVNRPAAAGRERAFTPWRPPYLGWQVLESPTPGSFAQVTAALAQGADLEGPTYVERLVRAFAEDGLGMRALSAQKRSLITESLPRDRPVTEGGDVIWPAGAEPEEYVDYRPTTGEERWIGHIPAIEIGNAMVAVIERRGGSLGREELFRETMRVFGASKLAKHARQALDKGLASALHRGRLVSQAEVISRGNTPG